jgi:uncharacterized protein
MHVASLHVYPVKGCRGIAVDRMEILRRGPRNDRRFMVLGKDGTFLTQRTHPKLALVETEVTADTLVLMAGGARARASLTKASPERRRVRVWDDDVEAVSGFDEADALFSDWLGERCTMVRMPEDADRPVEAPYGQPDDRVSFADAYPILLATLPSLAALNEALVANAAAEVGMDRFRPNIVVEGGNAWDEDRFDRVRVGSLRLRMPKRCSRCAVTTIDQATGAVGKEPLKTLASFRTEANKVYFAQNLIPDLVAGAPAFIAVGDEVVYHRADEA